MLKVASLFVDLSMKGGKQTAKGLEGIQGGARSVQKTSLAAKAAIVGMLYAFNRLSAASNAEGTSLQNFAATTGLSTKKLQQFQHAARQAGATNEDVAASFRGLQNNMAGLFRGEQIEGLPHLASAVDMVGVKATDTFAIFMKLQEFAQRFKDDPAIAKRTLDSFGISEGVQAGMFRGVFNEENFAQARTYSDAGIKALDKMRAKWTNLFDKMNKRVVN